MATKKTATVKQKRKKEYSKVLVGGVMIGVAWFIHWCTRAMTESGDYSALPDLIKYVCILGAIALMCYAFRCKQKDKVDIEMERLKNINEMKKKYGDDFIYEEMAEVNNDYPNF